MSFISYLINGISLGSVYAIIALGYTMVYGIAKMLNFAHGDVIMVGSYVVYVAVSGMGLNPILAILLSIIICTLMGVVIEGVAYRPLRNAASPLAVLITAIGVSYLLQNVALLIWGADTKSFSNVISLPSLKLAGGSIVITDLIKAALRMRPDRIIVGEVRGGEAMDMLQALNTGHEGSLSTAHANSARDMLSRLETMVLMGVDLPLEAIRRQIASGVDILVHLGRMRDKSRKLLEVTEVCGFENGEIRIRPLYQWQEGKGLVKTASLLHVEKLERAGIEL